MNFENAGVNFDGLDISSYCPKVVGSWIDREMKRLHVYYAEKVAPKVFCGTWNVYAKQPPEFLNKWIPADCDIIAVGFQEIVELSNLVHVTTDSYVVTQSHIWRDAVGSCLNKSGHVFKLVTEKSMFGLYLCIFVKEPILSFIKDVRVGQVATGVLGIVGNKGAVACSFILYDTAICVVNSHLASGRNNVEQRETEYHSINAEMHFSASPPITGTPAFRPVDLLISPWTSFASRFSTPEEPPILEIVDPEPSTTIKSSPWHVSFPNFKCESRKISHHDIVFWLGDMNSRIEAKVPTGQVFSMAKSKEFAVLQDYDQLTVSMKAGTAFKDYMEAKLSFPPTYKYVIGGNAYKGEHNFSGKGPEKSVQITNIIRASAEHGRSVDSAESIDRSVAEEIAAREREDTMGIGHEGTDESLGVRSPAWCDRVLFRVSVPYVGSIPDEIVAKYPLATNTSAILSTDLTQGSGSMFNPLLFPKESLASVEATAYSSCDEMTTSDHRPVGANFLCTLRKVDEEKEQAALAFLRRLLAEWEELNTPKLEVSVASKSVVGSTSPLRRKGKLRSYDDDDSSCYEEDATVRRLDLDMGLVLRKQDSSALLWLLNKSESGLEWKAGLRLRGVAAVEAERTPEADGLIWDSARWPKWIRMIPAKGAMLPGQVMKLIVSCQLDRESARNYRAQNCKSEQLLEAELVFSVKYGSPNGVIIRVVAHCHPNSWRKSKDLFASRAPTPPPEPEPEPEGPSLRCSPSQSQDEGAGSGGDDREASLEASISASLSGGGSGAAAAAAAAATAAAGDSHGGRLSSSAARADNQIQCWASLSTVCDMFRLSR